MQYKLTYVLVLFVDYLQSTGVTHAGAGAGAEHDDPTGAGAGAGVEQDDPTTSSPLVTQV